MVSYTAPYLKKGGGRGKGERNQIFYAFLGHFITWDVKFIF